MDDAFFCDVCKHLTLLKYGFITPMLISTNRIIIEKTLCALCLEIHQSNEKIKAEEFELFVDNVFAHE